MANEPKLNQSSNELRTGANPNAKKKAAETQPTLIIPTITPEMLEAARKAVESGTPLDEQKLEEKAEQAARKEQQEKAAREAMEQARIEAARKAAAAEEKKKKAAGDRRSAMLREVEALAARMHDDHLWMNNPVMMRGLGLATVVVAATSSLNALMLSAAIVLLLMPTRVLAVAVCHKTGNRFRPLVYCYAAAVLYIPVYLVLYALFGNELTSLGIYLPVLVVEPAIVKRMENPELESVQEAFKRGLNNTVGVVASVLVVGCLRELLAAGTMFGNQVFKTAPLPFAGEPAAGFMLVGLLAAIWGGTANLYLDYKREELKRRYAGRKR